MGKNSSFERNPRDFYPTPYEAALPLLRHISGTFIEPCAGDGRLIRHLEKHGLSCAYACDVEPTAVDYRMADRIQKRDVLFFDGLFPPADLIITNPPWKREILHRMIEIFRAQAPTWLLIDADWMWTAQARPYMAFCESVVSIGRVCWMGNGVSGKENCCWYKFISSETVPRLIL